MCTLDCNKEAQTSPSYWKTKSSSNYQFKKFSCIYTWDSTSSINWMQKLQLNHDSITPFTIWLQQNHINDTTAMKLRLCRVLNFCNSWAKGSPSPTWKSTNKSKTYCIIAGRLINKFTLLALKCFCTRWDVQLTMADISTKRTAVSTRHHIWPSEIICQIACIFRQRRQRLIKFKKFKLALPITFNG